METTIEQQVAMDEALVPSTQRLRIERSNLRLPSDIQSKESTLQLVYDVLLKCPFFKAFLVTADHIVNLESFRDMLHISPRIPGQSFDELPFKEEILEFIRFPRHGATIRTLTDVNINKLYQPWRSFAAIINKCLIGKSFGYDSFWLSQAQILWGLYHTRNIDYAFLIWKDFVYQVEHKNHKKSNEMYYPRFTKVIIYHFMSNDPSIPRRNKINWHYVRDDSIFSTIKMVSRHQNTQQRKRSGSDTSITPPTTTTTLKLTAAAKSKQPAKAKSLSDPSEVARTEAQQLKIVLRRRRQQTHISQPGGSGTDEETGFKPGVLDVPTDESEEELSWNSFDDEGADDQVKDGDDDEGNEGDESDEGEEDADEDKDGDERDDDEENQETVKYDAKEGGNDEEESESEEEDDNEEIREEENFDPIPRTPESSEDEGDGEEDQGLNVNEEAHVKEEEEDELYRDVNINQGRGLQATLEVEDTHVTLTPINSDGQQESSSVSSQFVISMLNPISDVGMEFIFATASSSVAPLHTSTPIMTPSTIATITTISQAPIPPTPIPSKVLKTLPTFDSVFCFDDRLKSLEANVFEYIQTNPFAEAVSNIPVAADLSKMELKKNLIEKMEGNKSIQRSDEQRNLYKALVDAYEADKTILDSYGETIILKRRRDDDDDQDEGPSVGSDRGSKRRRKGKEPESTSAPLETATRSACRSTTGSKSRQVSASESAFAEEPVQTTSQMDEPSYPVFETGAADQPIVQSSQHPKCELAKQADSRSSFNELLDTPLDFSNFIMNRLIIDTLTPELLAGPTYKLMKGSCTSLIELEYHLEEVYKATTNQLDWVNPEGQQYPHNLLQPLSLIPDNRGRRVIPFTHLINNDPEYLRGGASSRKYTTSVTKTKAADYENIKWIEDLVPLYGFAVNQESALDVYSKRRIIDVTDLKIVEWHSYKHLDWILVRRDDDKIYKFKEGDFKRIRLQDIEDMLLLLVQGKQSNLIIEERFAFNVSLRMFTRSIAIQRRVEDLQLGVKSYQKRLNLTKPDIDGTLNDVRTALDDRLKGIRMQYLPQTIWRKGDKDRAGP
uniref:Monodehydroascorbate reductase n=1 Tax=Tanacetum cinerariifolium TaxID=118510 RepID=A0A699IQV8_TANCI|nr:hypothetical protein [Tanacetum cinerariifolium]